MTSFQGYSSSGQSGNRWLPLPILASRDPVDQVDLADPSGGPYQIDQEWFNSTNKGFWKYAGQGDWVKVSGTGGTVVDFIVPLGTSPVVPNNTGDVTLTSTGGTVDITGGLNTINFDVHGGHLLGTLSDDVNTLITPDASNNIQLVGHIVEQGATKFSTVVAGTHIANINPMSSSRWIVDPLGFNGTHTTIASALTSATSGDTIFLLPGTYTENITLKAGVNITAYQCDSLTPNVTIVGKATMTTAGTVTISGIRLQTNSDFFLAVTGTANSVVNLINCYLNASNNTGISYTTTGTGSGIRVQRCLGDIGTTGIAMFSHSASALLEFDYCMISNSGASSSANILSGIGGLRLFYSTIANPISSSGTTATFTIEYSQVDGTLTNTTPVTCNSTAGSSSTLLKSRVLGGTASAISVGAGATLSVGSCIVDSSNTNAITGAGSVTFSNIQFSTNSSVINTTTQATSYMNLGKYKASGQPAFSAYKSSTTANATGDGTAVTVIFDTVVFDQNSNYNNGTGTFTAPVTGKYSLTFSVATSSYGVNNKTGTMNIVTTARTYVANTFNWQSVSATTNQVDQTMTVLADMTAGDTATAVVRVLGTSLTVGVVGGASWQTGFSGYLVA